MVSPKIDDLTLLTANTTLLAYSLGWKLMGILQKKHHSKVLSTYESERRPVAQELINFDRGYALSWVESATVVIATIPNGTTSNGTKSNDMTSNYLIFDRVASNGIKSNERNANNNAIGFPAIYMLNMVYTTGILIHYPPRELILGTIDPPKSPKAVQFEEGLTPGMRLPDFQILNQSDALPTSI